MQVRSQFMRGSESLQAMRGWPRKVLETVDFDQTSAFLFGRQDILPLILTSIMVDALHS